ncbi:MAG: hypothetical protein P8L37_07580, partial [Phycisphaerales bacterium]|nr:hypothetical protein [Phycisphaerales bacterium]
LVLAVLSPLPESLQHVHDDTEVPDKAFVDMINFVRSGAEVDDSVEITIHHDAIVERPTQYRGMYVTIEGQVEQQRSLGRPFADVEEWFVRDAHDLPWMIYVTGCSGQDVSGRRVSISGHVYKRMHLEDRAGVMRFYPALVGSDPSWLAMAPAQAELQESHLSWLILLVLIVALLVVLLIGRRIGRRSKPRPAIFSEDDETQPSLPDDPSEAMHELKRRGDESDT